MLEMASCRGSENNLHEGYDITPNTTNEPWTFLENTVFTNPDDRTLAVLKHVDRTFFEKTFITGTLVIVGKASMFRITKSTSPSKVRRSPTSTTTSGTTRPTVMSDVFSLTEASSWMWTLTQSSRTRRQRLQSFNS